MNDTLQTITGRMSIPALLLRASLAGGAAAVAYAFVKMGPAAGFAVACLPAALCMCYLTLRNPTLSMMMLFVINYFIMGVGRYAYTRDIPVGAILDALVAYNLLMVTFWAMRQRIDWSRAATGLTLAAAVWTAYCVLQLFNPETESAEGWVSGIRSVAINFLLLTTLTQLTFTRFKYLRQLLLIWSVLTLLAVGKACMQKFFGFDAAEHHWLYVLGGRSTHIIHSGVRYFSFFSDAANFGASMGLSMVVFSVSALYIRRRPLKLYLLLVAAAACYGMLISGTRSALAVPFVGYGVYILLSRNARIIVLGSLMIVAAFVFLKFTAVGQSNPLIRRARSAFNTDDPSFQVRLSNQAKLRELMADKPFGAGLGHGGGKALRYAPNSPLAQIPTDSWFVMIWVETGVVGIALHLLILAYILLHGGWLVMFRLRHPQVRGLTAALVAGMAGIVIMSYANEIFGQIPTGAMMYISAGLIFLAPRFDEELTGKIERQTL